MECAWVTSTSLLVFAVKKERKNAADAADAWEMSSISG
jgi:hypothetical protein